MKKTTIGLLLLILSLNIFASQIERFKKNNNVLIDTFSGLSWQDNYDTKSIEMDWQSAMNYCNNLVLNSKQDWRLPSKSELYYANIIKKEFTNIIYESYWTSTKYTKYANYAYRIGFEYNGYDSEGSNNKKYKEYVRCVRGKQFNSIVTLKNEVSRMKDKIIQNKASFDWKIVEKQNNITGYEWFLKKYTNVNQSKKAIKNIHKIAFNKAQNIDTISSYNTFIFAYPYASQVNIANNKAYDMEVKKYTDLGMFGNFFEKEIKLEKKARKLLIKAKQIERTSQDYSDYTKAGYLIVANRMYDLLQSKFDDSDATLRHLESQEFKDFVKSFKSIMSDIKYTLNKINSNVSNISGYTQKIVEVSKAGFSSAKADRDMTLFKDEEHKKWEKFMKFRDKGYN
jgi:hypothetical protein